MLAEKFKNKQIILASQSPRRQELLKGLDLDFKIETRPVIERFSTTLKRAQITDYLAQLKSNAFMNDALKNQIIITSDTIVWHNHRALNKPESRDEARLMLSQLSGTTHQVYTSVCFLFKKKQHLINDMTSVHFNKLTKAEIDYYISNYTPLDRAGSYGIQDWIGYTAVSKIEGCYYNVMGLPLTKVYEFLKKMVL